MTETKFGNIQIKFTPGKYHVVRHNWKECSIEADSGHTLCTSDIENEVDEDGENQDEVMEWQDAQMAFFAAAPEMYEELAKIESDIRHQIGCLGSGYAEVTIFKADAERILNTLAKARGEKQYQ